MSFLSRAFALIPPAVIIACLGSKESFHGCAAADTDPSLGKKWTLFHSIGGVGGGNDEWIRRGTVSLDIDESQGKDAVQLQVVNDEGCLSETALNALQSSSWYKLKLQEEDASENANEQQASPAVITTVSSCQLQRANFRDELVLTFGRQGHVVSFAYMPLVSPLAPKTCDDLTLPEQPSFSSRISYETAVPGMTLRTVLPSYQPPPGLKFISQRMTVSQTATQESPDGKPAAGGAGGGTGGFGGTDDDKKQQEEPVDGVFGFLKRYWYIIVPMMLMNLMAPAQDDQQQGQQQQGQQQGAGGGGGQQQSGQAAAAAAPSAGQAGGAAAAPKRRGKRAAK